MCALIMAAIQIHLQFSSYKLLTSGINGCHISRKLAFVGLWCRNAIPIAAPGSYNTGVQLSAGAAPPPLLPPQPAVAPSPAASNIIATTPAPAALPVQPIANTTAAAPKPVLAASNGTLVGTTPVNATVATPPTAASAPSAPAAGVQRNPFLPFQAVPAAALNSTPGDYIIAANRSSSAGE